MFFFLKKANCFKKTLVTLNKVSLLLSVLCRLSDLAPFPASFPAPEDPFRMPEERSPRLTPQNVPYQDLPHLVNADGQHLFCRYWKPSGAPRSVCPPPAPRGIRGPAPSPFLCSSCEATFSTAYFSRRLNTEPSRLTELRAYASSFLKLRSRSSISNMTSRM